MGYNFGYEVADLSGGLFVALIVMVFCLFTFGISIGLYVLQSLGLYRIAARRELKHPWLAWIPVGNMYLLGSLSDQYQYVVKGKVRNRRKVILGVSIAIMVLVLLTVLIYVLFLVNFFANLTRLDYMSDEQLGMILWPLLGMLGVCLIMEIVSIVLLVFEYIALYDLYRSCEPKNSVMYLVFSIVFPVIMPAFIFFCRGSDKGMPPKRTVAIEE